MDNTDLVENAQNAIAEAGIIGRVSVVLAPIPGVIKLMGEVMSESDRLRADQAARSADGVLDVIDEITISRKQPSKR